MGASSEWKSWGSENGCLHTSVPKLYGRIILGVRKTVLISTRLYPKLYGRIIAVSCTKKLCLNDNLPKLDALIFNQLSERQGQAESEAEHYRE